MAEQQRNEAKEELMIVYEASTLEDEATNKEVGSNFSLQGNFNLVE